MQLESNTAALPNRDQAKAAARLIELANGMRVAQAIYVAAELRIADFVGEGLITSDQIAHVTKTDPSALNRLLRALAALGLLSENSEGHFALTDIGLLLRTDAASSFRDAVRFIGGPTRWRCWADLMETVRTGVNRPEASLGVHLFDYYAMHPAEAEIESNAMRAFTSSHLSPIINGLDLRAAHTIVDVGGGTGQFLAGILEAYPLAHGILFDLPEVVKRAPEILKGTGVRERCRIEPGSFFEAVPDSGDVYLLKQILHDWDDDRAVAILEVCRRKLHAGAKIVVIERGLPQRGQAHVRAETFLADLEMLVMTPGGRERTEQEFRGLFTRAGLEHVRTVPSASPFILLEGRLREVDNSSR